MKLPTLDLDALTTASRQNANRQLVRYLKEHFDALAHLPITQERLPHLIDQAGSITWSSDSPDATEYATQTLIHVLLGLAWWNDPSCQPLCSLLEVDGLHHDQRLHLLTAQAIAQVKRQQAVLPGMLAVLLDLLGWHDDTWEMDRLWDTLARLMTRRGLALETHEKIYRTYETDACERYGLPPLVHRELNGQEVLAYRHYGWRIPKLSDALAQQPALQRSQIVQHILLAIVFGRAFFLSAAFTEWMAALDQQTSSRERRATLAGLLTTYQRTLVQLVTHA